MYYFFWEVLCILLVAYIVYLKCPMPIQKAVYKNGDYQIVVVVNKDLGMSKGKVLSQFGHAIDAMNEKLVQYPGLVDVWRRNGSAKIALKGTQEDLNRVYYEARDRGLLYARIHDAGRTQIKAGSNTVIAVGPATKEELEPVTGYLSLY